MVCHIIKGQRIALTKLKEGLQMGKAIYNTNDLTKN